MSDQKKTEKKQTIFITGASSGIGKATALRLGKEGWNVALAARSVDELEKIAAELPKGQSLVLDCDVTNSAQVEKCFEIANDTFGRIDAVYANAGTGGKPGGFSEAPQESWQQIVDINIMGLAKTIQAAMPYIKKSEGHFVVTGSVAGRRYLDGSMYSVSKHAANALAYDLRGELQGSGCRVTLIEPGMVDTPFFDDGKPDALRPDDVARAVAYAVAQPKSVEIGDILILPVKKAD